MHGLALQQLKQQPAPAVLQEHTTMQTAQARTVLVEGHLLIAEAGVDGVHRGAAQRVGNAAQRAAGGSRAAGRRCVDDIEEGEQVAIAGVQSTC